MKELKKYNKNIKQNNYVFLALVSEDESLDIKSLITRLASECHAVCPAVFRQTRLYRVAKKSKLLYCDRYCNG